MLRFRILYSRTCRGNPGRIRVPCCPQMANFESGRLRHGVRPGEVFPRVSTSDRGQCCVRSAAPMASLAVPLARVSRKIDWITGYPVPAADASSPTPDFCHPCICFAMSPKQPVLGSLAVHGPSLSPQTVQVTPSTCLNLSLFKGTVWLTRLCRNRG